MNFIFLTYQQKLIKKKIIRRQVTPRQNEAAGDDAAGLQLDNVSSTFNKGFSTRKALLGTSTTVNCEIPLNRYSFFEA